MIYILITAILFGIDTAVKAWIEKNKEEHKREPILKGNLYLTKFHNKGIALSKGEDKPVVIKWMSLFLTIIFLIIYIVTLGQKGKELLKAGLSILVGGALSNTCDRMTRGYVVDYVGFPVKNKRLRNVIYNLSDFFLLIGASISIIWAILEK